MRCKGCGNPLVTVRYKRRCVVCGRRASTLRSMSSESTWTSGLARKAVTRKTGTDVESLAIEAVRPLTWQDAERIACEWMRKNGYPDARLTPPGADGGIDVASRKAVAQVKHHLKPVGRPDVQRLYAVAQTSKRRALFFSNAGYTPDATAWAREHGVELLTSPPVRRHA